MDNGPLQVQTSGPFLFWTILTGLNMKNCLLYLIIAGSLIEGYAFGQGKNYIYFTDATYQQILRTSEEGIIEGIVDTGLGFPWRITYNHWNQKIYWTNVDYNLVQRANRDGSEIETLLVVTYPQGIFYDDVHNKLYISEAGTPQILRSNPDGTQLDTLITSGILDPDDISVDISTGRIFFVDTGKKSILYATPPRFEVKEFMQPSDFENPTALTIDQINRMIYWTDSGNGQLARVDIMGENYEVLLSGLTRPDGVTLDQKKKIVYWTDLEEGKIMFYNLKNKKSGIVIDTEVTDFHSGIYFLNSINK